MTSCSDSAEEVPAYDPTANGLNTYALACQLAREGHAGVREWFSEQGRPGSGAEDAQSPADLGRCGVAPARVTTKPAQSDDYGEFLAGKPKRLSAAVRQLIVAPRREHSRKPDEQYERIEALCPGPRLELFARHRRPGWTAWGNQLPPYDPTANGLNTYSLACKLAREGHEGLRRWFKSEPEKSA